MSFFFGKNKEKDRDSGAHRRTQSDKQTSPRLENEPVGGPPMSPTHRKLAGSDSAQEAPRPTKASILPEQPARPKPKSTDVSLKSSIDKRDTTTPRYFSKEEDASWEFGSTEDDTAINQTRKPSQVEITLASPPRSPRERSISVESEGRESKLTALLASAKDSPKSEQESGSPLALSNGSPDMPLRIQQRQRPVSEIIRKPINPSTSSEAVAAAAASPTPQLQLSSQHTPTIMSPLSPISPTGSSLDRSGSRKSMVASSSAVGAGSSSAPPSVSPPRRPVPAASTAAITSSGSFLSRTTSGGSAIQAPVTAQATPPSSPLPSAYAAPLSPTGSRISRPSVPVLSTLASAAQANSPTSSPAPSLSARDRSSTSGSLPRQSRDDPSLGSRLLSLMSPRSSVNAGKFDLSASASSLGTLADTSTTTSTRQRSSTIGSAPPPSGPDPLATKRREGELDIGDILTRLRDPSCGLEVRDRKKGLRTVRRAFVGAQFVDWLLQNGFTKTGTRAEAVAIASALLNSYDLECKSDDHGPVFHDGAALYSLPKGKDPQREKPEGESPPPASPTTNPLTGSVRGVTGLHRGKLWGAALADIMERDPDLGSEGRLPRVLPMLMHAVVVLGGKRTEGIFRVSPESSLVDALRESLEKGATAIACTDPHVPASALKTFLRDLKQPVIPDSHYPTCIRFCEDPKEGPAVVDSLPEPNRTVVKELMLYLREIAAPENIVKTKMSMQNIATVFAPCLLRCPSTSPAEIMRNSILETLWLQNVLEHIDLRDYKSLL